MQGQLLTSLKVCNMHSGYATAVSCTQTPHAVQSCSKTGLYGLRTFSAIFGPEMASEAIPGHLIFKFYLGGGACPQIPLGPSWCVLMQLGQLLHTQILGPGVNTQVYLHLYINQCTTTVTLVYISQYHTCMKQLLKFLLLQLLKPYKG